ncbi:phage tail protein [Providencia stuartii]|nr:phage tail protein [Providencia stuartii]
MKYFALLTKLGENLLAQATALGTKLELTHMAVGDGGGSLPTPDTNQTKLIKEQRRAAINTLFIDEKNKNQIIAEQIIPEKDGGWWIREIGLFDKDGNLIAVANCPETYKPQLVEGSGRTQAIRMVLIVSHTESVTLKIDPSVVLATRDYVNDSVKKSIEEHEKSRKHPDATTEVKGFVQLADTLSTDNTKAVTPKLATEINQRATNAQTTANTANTNATNANNNANSRVPSTRKVNNKPLSTDINLTAGDVGAYTKEESNKNFQPKGEYLPTGYSYSKTESDGKYATNTALNNGLGLKFDKTSVAQGTGTSTTQVMSQDSATRSFAPKSIYGFESDGSVKINTPSGRYFALSYGAYAGVKNSEGVVAWQFDPNGVLTDGSVPVSRLTGLSQASGSSETAVMSQAACSKSFSPMSTYNLKGNEARITVPAGYFFVSSGGYAGVKNTSEVSIWEFSPTGTLLNGTVPVQRITGLQQIGVNQRWKNVTSERSSNVAYTNTSTAPIMVEVQGNLAAVGVTVEGVQIRKQDNSHDYCCFIVPVGHKYTVVCGKITNWVELS